MTAVAHLRRLRVVETVPGYEPGLDGLRAIALAVIFCYHAEFDIARGGIFSVSLFFTLSGYLITSLLAAEAARTGRIDLRRFWSKRMRRLAPASLLTLLLIGLVAPWFDASGRPAEVRGDLLAALGYVANWRFLASDQSYSDLFLGGPSPVTHFWSLAIEEQFYLVYPAIIAGAVLLANRWRRPWLPLAIVSTLALASAGAAVIIADHDMGYYGTHLRAAELLIGGVAAYLVARVGIDRLRSNPRRWVMLGLVGSAIFVALTLTVRESDDWPTSGGFAVTAIVWCGIIVGALIPGPLRRALSVWPLVAIGKLSFSLYLVHWPLFLLVDADLTGLPKLPLFALRISIVLLLGLLSYLFVETPIRSGQIRLPGWRASTAWALATAAVVLVTVVQLRPVSGGTFEQMVNSPDSIVTFGTDAPPSTDVDEPSRTVVVVGSDRSGLLKVQHLANGADTEVVELIDVGCSPFDRAAPCQTPAERLADHVADGGTADVVVWALGLADHRAVRQRVASAELVGTDALSAEYESIKADVALLDDVRSVIPDVPLILLDASTSPDQLSDPTTSMLGERVLRLRAVTPIATVELTAADLGIDAPVERRRVLVIGDSNSYGVALGLDAAAGDRLEVVWAGLRNCPLVPAVEVRWWNGSQWPLDACLETQAAWPGLIADFEPEVLLAVVSLPEHSDQRYSGDDNWYAIGDQRFADEHLTAVQRLVDLSAPFGTRVLVADSVPEQDSVPGRVTAWNEFIGTWPSIWPAVSIVPFGVAVVNAETAAGRSLRPDGFHLDDATMRSIVMSVFIPALDAVQSQPSVSTT